MPAIDSAVTRWCYTLANPPDQFSDLIKRIVTPHVALHVYQQEAAPDTGLRHIQGFFVLKKRNRLTWLKTNIHPTCHFEKMIGSLSKNYDYCTKESTRIPNTVPYYYPSYQKCRAVCSKPVTLVELVERRLNKDHTVLEESGFILHKRVIDEVVSEKKRLRLFEDLSARFQGFVPREWQRDLTEIVQQQSDRQISFVFDSEGNSGKTHWAKYMHLIHGWMRLTNKTNMGDISHLLSTQDPPGVCFDIARNIIDEDGFPLVSYSSLEQVKDAMIDSTKYEGFAGVLSDKKVVVFTNYAPRIYATSTGNDVSGRMKLSRDRWQIFELLNSVLVDRTDALIL